MTELFPSIQPRMVEIDTEMPLYRETAWDFSAGKPLFRDGNPLVAEGAEAVRVWAWKALVTQRARFRIYTWDFGCELETLIGQNYTEQTKRAEAVRYVQEALAVNPYVTSVTEVNTSFARDKMTIEVTLNTIYGEVKVSV